MAPPVIMAIEHNEHQGALHSITNYIGISIRTHIPTYILIYIYMAQAGSAILPFLCFSYVKKRICK